MATVHLVVDMGRLMAHLQVGLPDTTRLAALLPPERAGLRPALTPSTYSYDRSVTSLTPSRLWSWFSAVDTDRYRILVPYSIITNSRTALAQSPHPSLVGLVFAPHPSDADRVQNVRSSMGIGLVCSPFCTGVLIDAPQHLTLTLSSSS